MDKMTEQCMRRKWIGILLLGVAIVFVGFGSLLYKAKTDHQIALMNHRIGGLEGDVQDLKDRVFGYSVGIGPKEDE